MITVAYTINLPLDKEINDIEPPEDDSGVVPADSFVILFDKKSWPLEDQEDIKTFKNSTDLTHAMIQGQILLDEKDAIEKNNPSLKIDSPSYRHQKVLDTNEKARNLSRKGYQLEGATAFIYR